MESNYIDFLLNKREENNRRLEELLQDEKVKEYASILKDSEIIKNRWDSYKKKYEYANDIDYDEIIKCIEEIVKVIVPVVV